MKFQYVCMFDDQVDGKKFKNYLLANSSGMENVEDEGHTICFVGAKRLLSLISRYKLAPGITLQVERRPAGTDPDEADAEGLVESFEYYGVEV